MFGKGMPGTGLKHKGKVKYKNLEDFLRHKTDQYFLKKMRHIEPETWEISKNYVFFQKFLPNNEFDTRVTTIGNRAFANRRFVRDNDFRASGSGKPDFNKNLIDLRFVKIALEISKALNFQSMAYDFLLNEDNQPEICEISFNYVDRSVYGCPGYWDDELKWHSGQFFPQFLHLKDSLNLDNIKQPDFNDILNLNI